MASTDNRSTRNEEKRELTKRDQLMRDWTPPSAIPEIPDEFKDPAFSYRWIRVSVNGSFDHKNVSSRLREGYTPVSVKEVPTLGLHEVKDGNFAGCIELGGLMLCKIPRHMTEQRKAYYEKRANDELKATSANLLSESDARAPLFVDKQETFFGKGS